MTEQHKFTVTIIDEAKHSLDDKHTQLPMYNVIFPKYLLGKISAYLDKKEDMNLHEFIMAALKEKLDREMVAE